MQLRAENAACCHPPCALEENMPEKPVVDPDLCTACNACIDACPVDAMYMNDEDTCALVNLDKCNGNGACETSCPTGAIELIQKD